MHLTRVTGANGHEASHAAATGGDGDLLAVLFGGEGDVPSTFPLTLEAALAVGETVEEPFGEGTGEALATPGDEGVLAIDVALAAALALGAATTPAPDAAVVAADGPPVGEAAAASSAILAVDGPRAGGGTTDTGAEGALRVVVPSSAAAESAVEAASPQAPSAEAANLAASDGARDDTSAAATAAATPEAEAPTSVPPQTAALASREDTGRKAEDRHARPTATTTTQDLVGEARPDARAATDADAPPSFEHDEGTKGDAEPGTFARPTATVATEVPAKLGLTATSPEAPQATLSDAPDGGAQAPLPPTGTTTGTTPQANGTAAAARTSLAPGTIEARWSERVSDAVRLSALRGGGEIRLQLEPEGLGHIDVRLHLHADGVRAVIVAEHESTRALLQSQQHVLQDAFGRSELRLSGFSVDVGSGGAASFQGNGDGGEHGHDPAAPSSPTPAAATDASESASVPLANGRVSVRV